MTTTIETRIAEVLAAHWSFSTDTSNRTFVDRCDGCHATVHRHGQAESQNHSFAAHQAAQLLPLIAEAQAVAWDEGGEAYVSFTESQHLGIDPPANPYEAL